MKTSSYIMIGVITVLIIIILLMRSKISTYASALDNTRDASIMNIDQDKGVIRGAKVRILKECKKLGQDVPMRLVEDGTCGE